MTRWCDRHQACPCCGLVYEKFPSGLTYRDCWDALSDCSEDPDEWRYKRRNTVLGYWHKQKMIGWELHLGECAGENAEPIWPDDEGYDSIVARKGVRPPDPLFPIDGGYDVDELVDPPTEVIPIAAIGLEDRLPAYADVGLLVAQGGGGGEVALDCVPF